MVPGRQRNYRFPLTFKCFLALAIIPCLFTQSAPCSPMSPLVQTEQNDDLRSLTPGSIIEREIAGAKVHNYSLALKAGDFVRLVSEQRGIDLAILLRSSEGKPQVETAIAMGLSGQKRLTFISALAGNYQLTVRSSRSDAAKGSYTLRVEDWRPSEPKDEKAVAGERAVAEADLLTLRGNADAIRLAIEKYEASLLLWRAAGERLPEAFTLLRIGLSLHNVSRFKEAIDRYGQALPIFEELGDERGVGQTLTNLGWSHSGLGQYQKAIEYYNRSLEIRRRLNDPRTLAQTLNLVADALQATGEPQQAIDRYLEALPLAQAAGDLAIEAFTLNGLGWLYVQIGEYKKARDCIERALPLWRKAGNRYGEAESLNTRGTIYESSFLAPDEALASYEQAKQIWKELGNRYGEAQVLNNTGVLYYSFGDFERARETYLQALAIWRAIGNGNEEAKTLSNLGHVESRLGRWQASLDYLNQSLALYIASGNTNGQASPLHNIAGVHGRMGRSEQAVDYLERALKLAKKSGKREVEAWILNDLGHQYEMLGDEQRAYDYYRQTLSMPVVTGLGGLARLEMKRGNLSEALGFTERVIAFGETRRARLPDHQLRASFTAVRRDFYELHADILMRMHERASGSKQSQDRYLAAALEASERIHARSLFETLTESHANIRQGVDPALLDEERLAQDRLNAREKRRVEILNSTGEEKRLAAVEREIQQLERDLQDVRARIRTLSPGYAALTQPAPLNVSEIQKLLDDDTILLEYLLGTERSFLWAVTPTSIKGYALPGRAEIETNVRRMYELAKENDQSSTGSTAVSAEADKVAATLSRTLIEPVAGQLRKKRLLIVSDGALHYIPFAALPSPGASSRSLIEDHEIVSLPSASVLGVLRRDLTSRRQAPKALAVLADPVFEKDDPRVATKGVTTVASAPSKPIEPKFDSDIERSLRDAGLTSFVRLRFSRQEAEAITTFLPEKERLKALDFTASRATAQSVDLGQYRILHFATHGLLNSNHPELSGLVFSLVDEKGRPQDGFLRFHEIYNLKLNADLVVLSACQTALGKEVRGEGLIGLTRGFMYAGVPRVVASLWRVDDRATAELMKRFYGGMLKDKLRPAAALRAAQISMLKEPNWKAPYYWAAFTLQGEWR